MTAFAYRDSILWHEIFAGIHFCGLAIFLSFVGTYFCDLDRVVFLAGNYILLFSRSPFKCIDNIFVVIEDVQSKNRF